jgi:hypothetical protein
VAGLARYYQIACLDLRNTTRPYDPKKSHSDWTRNGEQVSKDCARRVMELWLGWQLSRLLAQSAFLSAVRCLTNRVDRAGKPGAASRNIPITGT